MVLRKMPDNKLIRHYINYKTISYKGKYKIPHTQAVINIQ